MTGLSQLDVSSLLSYAVAVLFPALDALLPVLPSETAVIALGVATAGSADPRIALLIALAAFGAFLGDNAAYLLGRRFGPAVSARLFAGERGSRRRAWAERSLQRFGARIIIACRFIPGGRTAVTLTCGVIGYPRRSFVPATACAGAIWASYAFFIGRIGGKTFEDRPWAGLLLALALALVVSAVIEAARRAWRWRNSDRDYPRPGTVRAGGHGHGNGSARHGSRPAACRCRVVCASPSPRRLHRLPISAPRPGDLLRPWEPPHVTALAWQPSRRRRQHLLGLSMAAAAAVPAAVPRPSSCATHWGSKSKHAGTPGKSSGELPRSASACALGCHFASLP